MTLVAADSWAVAAKAVDALKPPRTDVLLVALNHDMADNVLGDIDSALAEEHYVKATHSRPNRREYDNGSRLFVVTAGSKNSHRGLAVDAIVIDEDIDDEQYIASLRRCLREDD